MIARVMGLVLAGLLLGVACREGDRAASGAPASDTSSVVVPGALSSELTGIWTVVGHHIPGVSAMTDAEAAAWTGRSLRLTDSQAVSGGIHCDRPTYVRQEVEKDQFLGSEFSLPPGSLKPVASLDRLTVLDVSCGVEVWAAMGGRLIGLGPERALAPWDGVFFELARDRDFQATGTEPFWRLELIRGKEIRFVRPESRDVVTPVPVPVVESGGRTVYHAVTEANDLRVAIESTPCTDAMSGKQFEATVTVTVNRQQYQGCGGAIP